MHAFVSGNIIDKHEDKLKEGNICFISNFYVKDYKLDDKFRCVNNEKQIIFTPYTEVQKSPKEDMLIANNMFDFYDLSDLSEIANQNIYLTGEFLLFNFKTIYDSNSKTINSFTVRN